MDTDVKRDASGDLYQTSKRKDVSNYTMTYRILKTILMISAWISFGINFELIGSLMEDLKILLSVEYEAMSFSLVIRNIGYMIVTVFIGLVIDKLVFYSESLMAFAKLLIILPNFLMPWIKIYWVAMSMFLIQGMAQAIYDVGGNSIILRLWDGISDSPVNAMHAGYGIGAMLSVSLVLPFIKVSGTNSVKLNESNSTQLTSDDIKLQVPYSIAGSVGAFVMLCFIGAQFFEIKNTKKIEKEIQVHGQDLSLKPFNNDETIQKNSNKNNPLPFVQKLLFGQKSYEKSSLTIVLVQLVLILFFFASASGVNNVLTAFMRTYLTLGPAKFSNAAYSTLASSYWICFTIGRFVAALIAFKMNAMLFFTILLLLNIVTLGLFCIPFFNTWPQFYYIAMCISGITSGPLVPSCFMIAKNVLKEVNSFLVSMFVIGLGTGGLISVYLTGKILDSFVPSAEWLTHTDATSIYTIPFITLACLLLCALFFTCIFVIKKIFKSIF